MNPTFGALAAFALFFAAGDTPFSQSAVSVEQEPQHVPVFENARVRVLDVRLPPGYVSLFHTHSHDNVSVRIATGPTRVDLPGANGDAQVPPVGRVVFNAATPPYTHRVVNVGTTPIRIIDVELLTVPPTATAEAPGLLPPDPLHSLLVNNARARIHRVVVGADQMLPSHTHARPWLQVIVTGSRAGEVHWRAAGELAPEVSRGLGMELVDIEVR